MGGGRSRGPVPKWVGSAVSLALFAAAIVALLSRQGDLERAWGSAREAPWWLIAAVVGLPLLNLGVVSVGFTVITRRFGRVGWVEMGALISSAWLLNYLPMRPGMIGRFAYHKKVNGIRAVDSVRVLIEALFLSTTSMVALVAVGLLVPGDGVWPVGWGVGLAVVGPPAAAWAAAPLLAWRGLHHWRYLVGWGTRYIDAAIWAARYMAVFELVGEPVSFGFACFLAGVSQVAFLIPISGNGVGLREWSIGLATGGTGILADVVNRAGEVIAALVGGLIGGWYVSRGLARHAASLAGAVGAGAVGAGAVGAGAVGAGAAGGGSGPAGGESLTGAGSTDRSQRA